MPRFALETWRWIAASGRTRVLAGAVAVVLLAGLLWYPRPNEEPAYAGKTLTEWLKESEKTFRLWTQPEEAAAAIALRAIGPEAIPELMRLIQMDDRMGIRFRIQRLTGGPGHPTDAPAARAHLRGLSGFAALGPLSKPALPDLVRLLRDPRPVVRRNAAFALGYMSSAAEPSVQALLHCLEDEDSDVSEAAVWAVGNLKLRADLVVPSLMQLLEQRQVTPTVFEVLTRFGEDARAAIPLLRQIAQQRDPGKSFCAKLALKELDATDPAGLNFDSSGEK